MKKIKYVKIVLPLLIGGFGLFAVFNLIYDYRQFYSVTIRESIVFNYTELRMTQQYDINTLSSGLGFDITQPYLLLLNSKEMVTTFESNYHADLPEYDGRSILVSFNSQLNYAYCLLTVNKENSSFWRNETVFNRTVIPEFSGEMELGVFYVYESFFQYNYIGAYDASGTCHYMVDELGPKG